MKINVKYLLAFIIIFLIEFIIALFINDKIIRPYIGDILVIILMYTFIKIFVKREIKFLSVYLFVFAAFIELLQLINVLELLRLQNNRVLSVVFGSVFDIKDIICYLIGNLILLIWDRRDILKSFIN